MKGVHWHRICYTLIILSLFHHMSCKHLPGKLLDENSKKDDNAEHTKSIKTDLCDDDSNLDTKIKANTTDVDENITKSNTTIDEECPSTNYRTYVKCLREKQRKQTRGKRQTPCRSRQSRASNCETCNPSCENSCNTCQGLECSVCKSCSNCASLDCCENHCSNVCDTARCANRCKNDCSYEIRQGYPERLREDIPIGSTVVIRPRAESQANVQSSDVSDSGTNITTIIHLHNIVNNTNNIDMPIKVKGTSINNITIHGVGLTGSGQVASENGTDVISLVNHDSSPQTGNNDCCHVVLPTECERINVYPFTRCFHRRRRSCGPHCSAKTVHVHQNGDQVQYIPQPEPRCVYSPTWPFVSCGHHLQSNPVNCEGCYNHYSAGNPGHKPIYTTCPYACYDQGYGVGPYYRQGPFYQPTFLHIPSCSQLGTCAQGGGNNVFQLNPFVHTQQEYQPKDNTHTVNENPEVTNETTQNYYPQNSWYTPQNNWFNQHFNWMYPQNGWNIPQNNWMYPQNNWMYPQNNWIYPQNNWMYPQNNWMYPQNNWFPLNWYNPGIYHNMHLYPPNYLHNNIHPGMNPMIPNYPHVLNPPISQEPQPNNTDSENEGNLNLDVPAE